MLFCWFEALFSTSILEDIRVFD